MAALLSLGFLIGMRHALEADHVAAVASLVSREQSVGDSLKLGAVWGAGHTLTLMVSGGAVLFLDAVIPEVLARSLELAVGVMLVMLGLDVLLRLAKARAGFRGRRHGERTCLPAADAAHPHVRTHEGGACPPRRGFPLRPLLVGMMHGMAGSAALILLALGRVHSPWQGLLYILLFGVGSIAGMALLASVISIPLKYSAARLCRAHDALTLLVGVMTAGLGGTLVYDIGVAGGLLV